MMYGQLMEKMKKELQKRQVSSVAIKEKAKKDTRKYEIIGAEKKTLNGCRFYKVQENGHYTTNDYYKILNQISRGGANTGIKQEIKKGLEVNGVKCDSIINTAEVLYENGEKGQKQFITYIDSFDTFKSEKELRDTIRLYLKDGYIKEWKSATQFATANGNLYNIEGDEIKKAGA